MVLLWQPGKIEDHLRPLLKPRLVSLALYEKTDRVAGGKAPRECDGTCRHRCIQQERIFHLKQCIVLFPAADSRAYQFQAEHPYCRRGIQMVLHRQTVPIQSGLKNQY